jgi:hypothetical protein
VHTQHEWADLCGMHVAKLLLLLVLGSTMHMWQMRGVLGLLSAWLAGLEMTGEGRRRQHGSPHHETTTLELEWHANACEAVLSNNWVG